MIRESFRKQDLDEMIASAQQGDSYIQNYLLAAYQPFIAKCVSEVCKRYIDGSDDEFSIGLSGFNEAMLQYSPEKGSFFSFAQIVVKRKVIDYIRSTNKLPMMTSLNEHDSEETMGNMIEMEAANEIYLQQQDSWYRREEIKDFKEKLKAYHLTLEELTKVSPKHKDARDSAVRVARILYRDRELHTYVQTKKKLPIKALLKKVDLSKKTLERNRKYILAIFIVLSENYVYLKEYLKGVGQ